MKKTVILLLLLALCVPTLVSCADLTRPMHKNSAISELDKLQAKLDDDGYEVIRADEAAIAAAAESLVSGEGVILKGELAGMLEYSYIDPDSGKLVIGLVIAVTDKADAKAIAQAYTSQGEDAGVTVNVTVDGRLVTVLRS